MRHLAFRDWFRLTACLTVFLLNAGCGNKKPSEAPAESTEQAAAAVREEVLRSLHDSGLNKQLHASGVYDPTALHDITLVPHYLQQGNKAQAAMSLGIYMSDLGYLVDFRRTDLTRRYFDGCFVLANHVGLKKQFSHAVELRFSDIISGNESLEKIRDQLFNNAENMAQGDEFKKMHGSALTGYYIEELYHMVVFAQSSPTMTSDSLVQVRLEVAKALVNQQSQVSNLIGYFDHVQLKSEGNALYQDFLQMQAKYQALDKVRLLNLNDPSLILEDKEFQEIVSFIVSIRRKITEI
jgi:hypothetical protein